MDDNKLDTKNSVVEGYNENALRSLQEYYVSEARGWIGSTRSDIEILVELQHYGGKTNLIDFSESYLVALFFACRDDNYRQKNGYLLIFPKRGVELASNYGPIPKKKSFIVHPLPDNRRAFIQRSVMLHKPKGYLEGGKEIEIPSSLKEAILDHLIEFCDISDKTLFPDIQGYTEIQKFIQQEHSRLEARLVWANKLLDEIKLESKFVRAKKQPDEKEHNEAIEFATRKIQEGKNVSIWRGLRAQVYQSRAQIHLARTRRKLALEDNKKALSDYDRAIELDDKNAKFYASRAQVLTLLGDNKKALSDYDRAIELDDKDTRFYAGRAQVHALLGNYKNILSDFDRAIELDEKNVILYATRASIYVELQEYDKALLDFDRAIELDDKNTMIYAARAHLHMELQEYDKAILDYDRAIELGGENALFLTSRAAVHQKRAMAYDVSEERSRELEKAQVDLNVALKIAQEKKQTGLAKLIQRNLAKLNTPSPPITPG